MHPLHAQAELFRDLAIGHSLAMTRISSAALREALRVAYSHALIYAFHSYCQHLINIFGITLLTNTY